MSQDKLEQAVENALEKTNVQDDEQVQDTKAQDTKPEDDKRVEDDKDSELEARTSQALQLLEALEDPKRAIHVIKNLASQAGLLSGEMTRKEEKQAIKGIRDIVREKLGENGSFIANELGEALEEIIAGETSKLTSRIEEMEAQRQALQFQRDYDEAISELKITEKEADEIAKVVDEMPWNGKTPLKSYLTKVTRLVRSEAAEKARKQETRQKQQRNIESQTKTQGVESNEDRVKRGSAKVSVEEAVLAALRGEQLD